MEIVGWAAFGVTAWAGLSVPSALLVGAVLRAGIRRPAPRRAAGRRAGWERYAVSCVPRHVPVV